MNAMEMLNKLPGIEQQLNSFKAEGESGGGMVKIELDGQYDIVDIKISKEVMKSEDPELLEDLIISAHTDASQKIKMKLKEQLLKLSSDYNLPLQ